MNRTTQRIIYGHLRVAMALREGQAEIPVTYIELTEAEEAQALLSLDPIAAMAASDAEKVDELLRMIQTDDERVMQHLADLAAENGITAPDFEPVGIEEQGRLDQKKPVICPSCGEEFIPK